MIPYEVLVHNVDQSHPVRIADAVNVYTKGGLLCVARAAGYVDKFPLCRVFRVREPYRVTEAAKEEVK